jgi:hypothetical protein
MTRAFREPKFRLLSNQPRWGHIEISFERSAGKQSGNAAIKDARCTAAQAEMVPHGEARLDTTFRAAVERQGRPNRTKS